MDQVLSGLQGTELFVYLDDIVLYASSLREHIIKFSKLADRLRKANLKLQPDKCEFLKKEVVYLGHVISAEGVKPDPQKVQAVEKFPRPTSAKNIKQFLGLAGYYRRFIPDFSKTAKPLTTLLRKDKAFVWSGAQEEAFTQLRQALCSKPILQYPDFTQPFVVTTDASGYAIGGVLSQGTIGKDLPIAYTSRLLNTAESNYSTIEKELLAIVYCVNYFRPYLYGRKFTLVTDHKPLVWLHSVKDPTSRFVRWRLKLAEYDYEVVYKAGKANANADALSRNPVSHGIFPLSRDKRNTTPLRRSERIKNRQPAAIKPSQNLNTDLTRPLEPNATEKSRPQKVVKFNLPSEIESLSDSESDSESDEPLSDPANELPLPNDAQIIDVRDNLQTRNDNIVIFTTLNGEPCDIGARILRESNQLPRIEGTMVGRAKVINLGKKNLIALIIEERVSATLQLETLKEVIGSLCDVVNELQLKTVSLARGPVIDITRNTIRTLLAREFRDSPVKIIICSNEIKIPSEQDRTDIIKENHCSAIGGHKGVTKTLNRIKYKYHWSKIKEDVQNFIRNCRDCQLKKLVRLKTRQPMTLTDTPNSAFEKISMDIMGPLPMTEDGYSYILTIQDLLSKYSLAIPLRCTTASDIAEAFVNEFICTFGVPKAVLTDQGRNFVSSLMKNVARKFKIKQCRTTAYRPQSNGSVERSHHVLCEYLKQFVEKDNWNEYLRLACFSYNTSVHEGIWYTPHELVFGKVAETPSSDPPLDMEKNETYSQYLSDLFNKICDVQNIVRKNLINSKLRSKHYYDRKMRPQNFNIGDFVYMLREPLKNKLSSQYMGPYKIIEVLGNKNVKLEIKRDKTRTVHTDKLKLAVGNIPTPP
ncbi:uncharacterized protein LOC120359490 [Solenopsis invicta]|uniref:uncharacterized protein LOC120359490 n=1 Tax=Solenopsis invicta TaxID=13686 RepID=UPI00193E0B78|nr:uncharacterized protein LOC120359490 [Solenopsis invicta]